MIFASKQKPQARSLQGALPSTCLQQLENKGDAVVIHVSHALVAVTEATVSQFLPISDFGLRARPWAIRSAGSARSAVDECCTTAERCSSAHPRCYTYQIQKNKDHASMVATLAHRSCLEPDRSARLERRSLHTPEQVINTLTRRSTRSIEMKDYCPNILGADKNSHSRVVVRLPPHDKCRATAIGWIDALPSLWLL